MSGRLLKYHPGKRSVIGVGTSSFGSTTLYSRKSRRRYGMHCSRPVPTDIPFLQDYERVRQVYRTMLTLVPHKQFTFAKSWIMAARFEVRQLDLSAARRLLGSGIGMCPKEALFKGYIQLEMDVSPAYFLSSYARYVNICSSCGSSTGCGRSTRSI